MNIRNLEGQYERIWISGERPLHEENGEVVQVTDGGGLARRGLEFELEAKLFDVPIA